MDKMLDKESEKIQFISLDDIIFDTQNPRIPKSIDAQNEGSVLEWMLNRENIIDLMNSIGEKGFFPGEPILVVRDEKVGKYIVVEGNRRYTASYLLLHPEKAPIKKGSVKEVAEGANYRPANLPALIFESRDEILDYLGYRHITGVEPWDALAKARYLSQLCERLDRPISLLEKYRVLAKQIGSTTPYVRQLLLGKQLYDKIEDAGFYSIPTLDDKSFEFGTFYTAIVKPNISQYVGVDIDNDEPLKDIKEEHLEDLTKWMFEKNGENQTRLGESRNLGRLDKILDPKYSQALAAFKDGKSLSIAAELTDEADDIVRKKISEAESLIDIAWTYFPKVQDYSAIDKEKLKSISRTVKLLYDGLVEKVEPKRDIDIIE